MRYYTLLTGLFAFIVMHLIFTTATYAQNQSNTNDTLYVINAVLAKNVVEREPVDIVQSYDVSDDEGWCFARIYNSEGLLTITFKWYHEDSIYIQVDAKIGESKSWRTYSNVQLKEGPWRIEIIGPDNSVLKEIRFNVSE